MERPEEVPEEKVDMLGCLTEKITPGVEGSSPEGRWGGVRGSPSLDNTYENCPRKIYHVDTLYSEIAMRAGIQGVVIMEAIANIYGNVVSTKPLRSLHPALEKTAKEVARQWKYEPTIVNEGPIPSSIYRIYCVWPEALKERSKLTLDLTSAL